MAFQSLSNMNTQATTPKENILFGTDEMITDSLNKITLGEEKFTTKTALKEVAGLQVDLKLAALLEKLWDQIEANWKRAGRRAGGSENWRWGFQPDISSKNPSAETRLEKALAAKLPEARWANQVPTASRLIHPDSDRKRNIDIAHWDGVETVTLIELKVPKPDAKTKQTPLLAAFEIVRNGLLLCLARKYPTQEAGIKITKPEVWRDAKKANLRVVAPNSFYDPQYSLGRFERELNRAVAAFRKPNSPEMSFAFGRFDTEPTGEPELFAALAPKLSGIDSA